MKNSDRRAVDIASNEASSVQVPQKSKFRLSRKFLFFTASALILGASLGLTQSVKADTALTLTGIQYDDTTNAGYVSFMDPFGPGQCGAGAGVQESVR